MHQGVDTPSDSVGIHVTKHIANIANNVPGRAGDSKLRLGLLIQQHPDLAQQVPLHLIET